ncbi:MAG: hypothetical protein ACAH17_00180 [Candidatus Paceibacterota bacterium]
MSRVYWKMASERQPPRPLISNSDFPCSQANMAPPILMEWLVQSSPKPTAIILLASIIDTAVGVKQPFLVDEGNRTDAFSVDK